jgi:hypothetical protein
MRSDMIMSARDTARKKETYRTVLTLYYLSAYPHYSGSPSSLSRRDCTLRMEAHEAFGRIRRMNQRGVS